MVGSHVVSAEDRLAICDLFTTYAHAVDQSKWALYRSVFTRDAVIDYTPAGGKKGSVEEITRWMSTVFTVLSGQHMVANIDVRDFTESPEGDRCSVRALFHNPASVRLLPWPRPLFCVGGWYVAELVRKTGASTTVDNVRGGALRGWRVHYLTEEISYNAAFSNAVLLFAGLLYAIWQLVEVTGLM